MQTHLTSYHILHIITISANNWDSLININAVKFLTGKYVTGLGFKLNQLKNSEYFK